CSNGYGVFPYKTSHLPFSLLRFLTQMESSNRIFPNRMDSTCSRLLRRLAENEPSAWDELGRVYGPVVRYWIRSKGLTVADLADVFQEVFLAIARNIASFQREEGQGKFRAWLKTITFSKIYDYHRRQSQEPHAAGGTTAMQKLDAIPATESAGSDGKSSPENVLELSKVETSFLTQEMLKVIRESFSEKTWQAFYRTAIDGQCSRDIAKELGMTAPGVRRAKFRVVRRLRALLDEEADAGKNKGD
ncbi:MAG: sigma-70 family RNA polymerase sigma factor, partial [Planctomycetaceae bacterium]|nr:sigma-70 family RNA polymerase sigma factor [Planctomycetaceae bacterium]